MDNKPIGRHRADRPDRGRWIASLGRLLAGARRTEITVPPNTVSPLTAWPSRICRPEHADRP